ncbi:hypothetical protein KIN20_003812 [Parelaphostrongylus tenuis]|uniref:Uncharacterized protein n=1 Tax=Parelaphostrongylus tenuis TaxID=148309 RepID=A0AAD5MIZ2_PARTN|nr:hypothetical protein KIN20_003812 [Parelaphostrongylus tenuis]
MPQGQARTTCFTASGFSLPVIPPWVFTFHTSFLAQVSGIAPTSDASRSFISLLVMQTIIDVLKQQGLSAGSQVL